MDEQKLADSFSYINYAPQGTMTCDAVGFGTPDFKAAFLIREKRTRLCMLPEPFHIEIREIRSSLLKAEGVALIPLLIQFDRNPNMIYQEWLNYYESEIIQNCFHYLSIQDLLFILFFTGEIMPAKSVTVSNNLQLGFKQYIRHVGGMPPWCFSDFERLKGNLLRKFPTTLSLWDELKKPEGRA